MFYYKNYIFITFLLQYFSYMKIYFGKLGFVELFSHIPFQQPQ